MDVGDDMMLLLFLMLLAAKLSCVITVLASNYLIYTSACILQDKNKSIVWTIEFWILKSGGKEIHFIFWGVLNFRDFLIGQSVRKGSQ